MCRCYLPVWCTQLLVAVCVLLIICGNCITLSIGHKFSVQLALRWIVVSLASFVFCVVFDTIKVCFTAILHKFNRYDTPVLLRRITVAAFYANRTPIPIGLVVLRIEIQKVIQPAYCLQPNRRFENQSNVGACFLPHESMETKLVFALHFCRNLWIGIV